MRFTNSLVLPLRLVFIMWAVFLLGMVIGNDLSFLGIIPRSFPGLIGIFTAPFIHGNFVHLVSNTIPLLFLGAVLFVFYDKIARNVFFICYFMTSILVWIFARPSIHIGASGLVYGIAFFLIFFGLFKKEIKSIVISVTILVMYGGLIYGVFPNQPGVSWESHLLGGFVGIGTASYFGNSRKKA